ncbi:hypothetical protein NQ318_019795 [Aromia moschata]|uniref:Uncharacterized protein n=1 Tax=Aromia moschata TaxID=1265417 RepID=A0AAV8YKH7_9CUCU|nr:hypothetical protein NQ318_019795 [Aromia moschata]
MECYDDRFKNDVFKAPTTYRNDYKRYCDFRKETYNYNRPKFEKPEKPPPPAVIEDHETFSKLREGIHVPFDLLLAPKPIVNTNPHVPFQKLEPLGDPSKEKAIRTRPRLYMTPAVSIDDVPDPEMRRLLIDCMYTTEWRAAEREATSDFKRPPMCTQTYETGDVVKMRVDPYKPIEERFNRRAIDWDRAQTRSYADTTREFWIHKDPPVMNAPFYLLTFPKCLLLKIAFPESTLYGQIFSCGACVDPFKYVVPEETKRTIAGLIAEEKLRLPHDKPSPSYAGHKPEYTDGVTLAKVDLPAIHPYLSTAQAITSRYAEDMKK